MGNTHSMNNLSMVEQKRYQTEFLRYSQIPYESQYRPQHPNVNHHQYNKFKEPQQMPNPVKVLPDTKFEPAKLRSTNNGHILQSGGTISGRKESECGLHRSKSISETQNTYLSNNPNGMSSPPGQMQMPPQFKMQRASTQLSINLNHHQPMRGNLNKNFGSSHDLKFLPEVKTIERKNLDKSRDLKKSRAPPPPNNLPVNHSNNNNNSNRMKMSPPSTSSPSPSSDQSPTKVKGKAQRLFGDTLTKNLTPNRAPAQQPFTPTHPIKSKEPVIKSAVSKIVPPPVNAAVNNSPAARPSRINPISYLRRERTFDMTLTQTQNAEKFKPKFSPQFQRKTTAMMNLPRIDVMQTTKTSEIRQMTTQERYRANLANRTAAALQSELSSATQQRTTITAAKTKANDSNEKMKTIDKKVAKKKQAAPPPANSDKTNEKPCVEAKKSSDNSAISNPTMSTSSSFKYSKAKQQSSMPYEMNATPASKELPPEIVGYIQHPPNNRTPETEEEDAATSRESIIKENNANNSTNNFYYGMQEASVDTDDEIENEPNHAQMDAINKFAEDIFKMSGSGSKNQAYSESIISDTVDDDSEKLDITINLRPTLPRRQLQIPRFSPLAAWKSLAVENGLSESKNSGRLLSSSMLQLHADDVKQETKIERIYREPSFHMQMDNKSGDSGISADKEIIGNSPDSAQMPQAYLVPSWTPQQDLEEDEESVEGKENFQPIEADKSQSFATTSNGHMFSLSLPRDNHSVSDQMPQNNFYSLQKFRKSVAEVFGSGTNINDANNKVQIHNYGVDSNWLLGSQPNSIDELSPRKEVDRNQIMSHMTSGKHVMYLPTNMDKNYDEKPQKYESTICITAASNSYEIDRDEILMRQHSYDNEKVQSPSKSHKFKFQSTIRKIERKKMAEKLSKEAEEQEMQRIFELEAMQRVEEEFQKKRAREKSRIRHQLRIASLEAESYDPHCNLGLERLNNYRNNTDYRHNDDDDDEDEIDTRTPYISRIIEAKSPRIVGSQYKS